MKRTITGAMLLLGAAPLFAQPTFFGPRIDISIAGAACSAVLDANADGRPDLAVCGTGAVYLLLQNAASPGTFAAPTPVVNVGAGNGVIAVAVADFNRAGKADLMVATSNGSVGAVLLSLGNGNGTFQAPTTVVSSEHDQIVVADFNGDGKPDVLTTDNALGLGTIYLGDGAGGFSTGCGLAGGGGPASAAVGDFNKDGKPDVAKTGRMFLGNGDGTVGIVSGTNCGSNSATGGTNVVFEQVADFNNDGQQDIAFLVPSVTVNIALGNGDGTVQPSTSSGPILAGPAGFGSADFNFDGHMDVVELASSTPGALNILLGTGGGTVQATAVSLPACTGTTNRANEITIGDLNGDGAPDVIASCPASNVINIFLSAPPSVFLQTSVNPATPGQSVGITAIVGSLG